MKRKKEKSSKHNRRSKSRESSPKRLRHDESTSPPPSKTHTKNVREESPKPDKRRSRREGTPNPEKRRGVPDHEGSPVTAHHRSRHHEASPEVDKHRSFRQDGSPMTDKRRTRHQEASPKPDKHRSLRKEGSPVTSKHKSQHQEASPKPEKHRPPHLPDKRRSSHREASPNPDVDISSNRDDPKPDKYMLSQRENLMVGSRYYEPTRIEDERRTRKYRDMVVGSRYYGTTREERDRDDRQRSRLDHREKEREPRDEYARNRSDMERRGEKNGRRNVANPSEEDRKQDKLQEESKPEKAVAKKQADPVSSKTGGAYIPPAMLKMMQASITDKSSAEYQRISWEALKKSIHGLINKVNRTNIDKIIRQLLKENIVRGRGLLCRSIIQAQAMSPTFTPVYSALVALINSRFPNIGELLLKRLVIQFRRGFKRNDKASCIAAATFIAHLVNQRVAHEIVALEILTLLVETANDDSIEVAIAFLKECGMKLTEVSSKGVDAIIQMLRNVLHERTSDSRSMHMIQVMMQIRKDKFKDHESIPDGLDLVEEEDQFTHLITLDDATDAQDILNVFKFDPEYLEHEEKYKELSKEIVGEDSEDSNEEGDDEDDEDEDEQEGSEDEEQTGPSKQVIVDNTETNLVALRRTIYLTIYSSLDFEECAHKLMRMNLKPGQEPELCAMILDCCCEMRTYERFFGLLAQRFCQVNRAYIPPFEALFKDTYTTVHRLKTSQCRNVAKLFAHLLFTDAISWNVLSCIRLNEEDTTSSGRIFIKILFHELSEYMGLVKLNDRVKDGTMQEAFSGLFPRDNPRSTRFSINFFTSIGLGGLTDELREHLKTAAQTVPSQLPGIAEGSSSDSSDSDSEDDSSSSSSSNDSTESSDDSNSKKRASSKHGKKKKSDEKPKKKKSERSAKKRKSYR